MKAHSKDVFSWEKCALLNENVSLKGQFINQKPLYLCAFMQKKHHKHFAKPGFGTCGYSEEYSGDAVVFLLIFWISGNVLCLWQDVFCIFYLLCFPEKRYHFVWDSLYHSAVDKKFGMTCVGFCLLEKQGFNSIYCSTYDLNLIVKEFSSFQISAAKPYRFLHAFFHW